MDLVNGRAVVARAVLVKTQVVQWLAQVSQHQELMGLITVEADPFTASSQLVSAHFQEH